MRLTVDTDILSKENLTLGEFLLMLMGYYEIDYSQTFRGLVDKNIVQKNVFKPTSIVLSNNTKDLIARIITESNEKLIGSNIDFEALAVAMQLVYPSGIKPGTTYGWRGNESEVAQKLRALVTEYDFTFTEEEAVAATEEYVSSFRDKTHMRLLKYFILRTDSEKGVDSPFMTLIQNMRDEKTNTCK